MDSTRSTWRRCAVCGAATGENGRHRHEDPDWSPRYDDFKGALEGYECVTVDEADELREALR